MHGGIGDSRKHQDTNKHRCNFQQYWPFIFYFSLFTSELLPFLVGIRHFDIRLVQHLVELLVCIVLGMQEHPDLIFFLHASLFLKVERSFLNPCTMCLLTVERLMPSSLEMSLYD